MKKTIASSIVQGEKSWGHSQRTNIVDLDTRNEEYPLNDELELDRIKAKSLKPILYGNFKTLQLSSNPLSIVKIRANLPTQSKKD